MIVRRALLFFAATLILSLGPISHAADRDPFQAPAGAGGSVETGQVQPGAAAEPGTTNGPGSLPRSGYDLEGQIVAAVAALALGAAFRVGARAATP